MSEYKTEFTEAELKKALGKNTKKAERILEDPEKTESLLGKAKTLLEKIKGIPVIGALVDEIITMIELVRNYVNGRYRAVPLRVIISIVAAIIYIVSPVDLIPDCIPLLGFLDDAAIVSLILSIGVGAEINKYRKWKEQLELNEINGMVSEYEANTCANEEDDE